MWDDPIVKEVRDARLEIENECDGDFHKIYERALNIQESIGNGNAASFKKTMDEIGGNARRRGLTPEILDSIPANK